MRAARPPIGYSGSLTSGQENHLLAEFQQSFMAQLKMESTQPVKIWLKEVVEFSRSKANLRMAETCLVYLRYFSDNDITLTKGNITSYPFARPCALIWDSLYREVLASSERVDMVRLKDMVLDLFSSPTATLNWVKLSNPDKDTKGADFDIKMAQVKPAVYYAAHSGMPDIVKLLVQEGSSSVDEVVGPPFGTPLVAACAMGRTNVASLLLGCGAEPNLSGHFSYGTPLAAAIESGRIETVKFLLRSDGVDISGKRHPPMEATDQVLGTIEEYDVLKRERRRNENEHEYRKRKNRCIEIGLELIELAKSAKTGDGWEEEYGSDGNMNADFEKQLNHSTQSTDTERTRKNDCAISEDSDDTDYRNFLVLATAASDRIIVSCESMVYIATAHHNLDLLEVLLTAGADPMFGVVIMGRPYRKPVTMRMKKL